GRRACCGRWGGPACRAWPQDDASGGSPPRGKASGFPATGKPCRFAKGTAMVPNANARFFLLKAKQRDLIAACGGQIRSAEICHYGKSTVGRWADPNSPELMPLDALFALEEECGRYDMSEAIASARGRRLADCDEASAADNASIMSRQAEAAVHFAELMSAAAMAFADNR